MKYQLICTTYTKQLDGSLQLRNNWTEPALKDEDLSNILDGYSVDLNLFKYPSVNSISEILEGILPASEHPIHIRIIRFN